MEVPGHPVLGPRCPRCTRTTDTRSLSPPPSWPTVLPSCPLPSQAPGKHPLSVRSLRRASPGAGVLVKALDRQDASSGWTDEWMDGRMDAQADSGAPSSVRGVGSCLLHAGLLLPHVGAWHRSPPNLWSLAVRERLVL